MSFEGWDAAWREAIPQALSVSMRRGDVRAVRGIVKGKELRARAALLGGDVIPSAFREAEAWLREAEEYELKNGADSRLDRSDPYVRDVIVPGWAWEERAARAYAASQIGSCAS